MLTTRATEIVIIFITKLFMLLKYFFQEMLNKILLRFFFLSAFVVFSGGYKGNIKRERANF